VTTAPVALTVWMARTAAHGGKPQQTVTVFLLDKANEPIMTCIPAQALAGRMFAAIGISLEWAKGKLACEYFAAAHHHRTGDGDAREFQDRCTGVSLTLRGLSHYCVR
jgi:hypothetical protein